jgi:hypothetical protein
VIRTRTIVTLGADTPEIWRRLHQEREIRRRDARTEVWLRLLVGQPEPKDDKDE